MTDHLRELPFPRGTTFSDQGLVTMDDSMRSDLEGKLVQVEDTVHDTGEQITLRIVKNDTGGDITVAKKCGEFSTTTDKDYGARIGTFPGNTAGAVGKPIDDAYTVGGTIPDLDLFYVVEEGLCDILTEASAANIGVGEPVAMDGAGCIEGVATGAAAGQFVIGMAQESQNEVATAVLIRVQGGIIMPPAAG